MLHRHSGVPIYDDWLALGHEHCELPLDVCGDDIADLCHAGFGCTQRHNSLPNLISYRIAGEAGLDC